MLGALQGSGDRHVLLGRGGRVGERVGVVEGDGVLADRGGHDAVDGGVEVGQPDAVDAGLALCLGAQVPDLPGRTVLGDPLDDTLRGLGDPLVGDVLGVRPVPEAVLDHVPDGLLAADDRGGLGQPRGPLVGLGAGCVLGLPGLVPRLLREGDGLTFGRRATVLGLEGGRQLAAAGLDGAVPLGPGLGQTLVDADDLAHGPLVDDPCPNRCGGSRNEPPAGR